MDGRAKQPRMHEYSLPGGFRVIAGRTDEDNDSLSPRVPQAGHWWFHVWGMPGSHVILTHEEGAEPDREAIYRAAAIAAWHSKARSGGVVAVSCTLAKNVTKARGAKAGTVQIRREIVLKVRPGLGDARPIEVGG